MLSNSYTNQPNTATADRRHSYVTTSDAGVDLSDVRIAPATPTPAPTSTAILDLQSRRCVGFAMGVHHDAALARAALCMAIAIRGAGVTRSMGRTG